MHLLVYLYNRVISLVNLITHVKNVFSTIKLFNRIKKILYFLYECALLIPPKPFASVTVTLWCLPIETLLILPAFIEQALNNVDINTLRGFAIDPNTSMEHIAELGERCAWHVFKTELHPQPGDPRWRGWNRSIKYDGVMRICAMRNPEFANGRFYRGWLERYGDRL